MQDEADPPEQAPLPSRREQLQDTLRRAVLLASEDPDAFVDELRIIARRFGMTLSEVYAKLEQDPETRKIVGRDVMRRGIQGVAKALRERLGL